MTFKECLIIGLVIITVVDSDKCYNTKCKTGENAYVDCDPMYNRCREYAFGMNGSCSYMGYEPRRGGYEYCLEGQTCVVDSITGKASCEGEAVDVSFDFKYIPIVIGIIAASVVAIALGFLSFYCYKRSNAFRFGNQRVSAAQPVTYNTAVPPTTAHPPGTENVPSTTQYPPPQYPPPQYPHPVQYPPVQYPPAQYPPAQYPPAQYPPAQYPPPPGGQQPTNPHPPATVPDGGSDPPPS